MKILVIHGEDVRKSMVKLDEVVGKARVKGWEINRIDAGKVSQIQTVLRSDSLFDDKRLFVLENINKLAKKDLEWLIENCESLEGFLVIFQEGVLGVKVVKALPKTTKFESFPLPKLIFTFCDSFYPGNGKKCLQLLHEVIKTEPVEFLFSLLAKQIRDLYWAKVDFASLPYPSWRAGKLKSQATRFSIDGLTTIITKLSEADIAAKTSEANLLDSLDLIIVKHLE